jgi:hypothetical protein
MRRSWDTKKAWSSSNQASGLIGSPAKSKDRTFRAVFRFLIGKMKHKSTSIKVSRQYPNPIALAQEWQNILRKEDCASSAGLARKLGICSARVTQVLRLLSLAPEVIDTIATLGDPPLADRDRTKAAANC